MLGVSVALPLILAVGTPWLVRRLGRSAGYIGATVLLGLAVALARLAPDVLAGRSVATTVVWLRDPRIELALRLDTLSLVFSLIVLLIGALVLAYAARYFSPEDTRTGRVVALLTVFAGAMLGLVLADDAVLLLVFWELTSVTSFLLIGGRGEGKVAATRAFVVTALGGLALLGAVALLTVASGTASLSAIAADPGALRASPFLGVIVVLVILAAATKSAQVPFHFWLPGAMVAPTPVSTYLHAATMVKAGIYLLLRLAPVFDGVLTWHATLVVVGGVTAVHGAWVAIGRDDLKALLANSTVSQLGLIVTLIGIGTPTALLAAVLHTAAHAVFKAALFMGAGVVDHEAGTRSLAALGGLARTLPRTAIATGLAALSMAGIPPLIGFVTKEEALAALLEATGWTARVGLVAVVVAGVGTVAYSLRLVAGVFLGPERTPAHRAPVALDGPALLLGLTGLAGGLAVARLSPLATAIERELAAVDGPVRLKLWHGLSSPLLLTVLIVALGVAVWSRSTVLTARAGRLTGGDVRFDRTYGGVLAGAGRVARTSGSLSPAVFVVPLLAAVLAVLVLALATVAPSVAPPAGAPLDWALILLLVVALGGVVQARSRIAAIGTLGLTGFLVATWFVLHGAPDLALTQLLVETLTVAIVALVFRRLPPVFDRAGRRRRVGAAVVAGTVGASIGTLTWLLTGRRPRSEIGGRFLAEAEAATGGSNVVNTILVDFRALDTLGEVAVVGVAALGVYALVRLGEDRALVPPGDEDDPRSMRWLGTGAIDSVILRIATSALAPVLIVASLWLLVRGHDAVGGGFIGGLTAGAAVVLLYLSRGHEGLWQHRVLRTVQLVGGGLVIAIASGAIGLAVDGSFLAGGKATIGGVTLARSLVFDVGVTIVVVGLVVGVLRHLGQGLRELRPAPDRGGPPAPDATPIATHDASGTRQAAR